MNELIAVTEIRIKIGEAELILTSEQAKKLRDVLVGLLGSNITFNYPYQISTTPFIATDVPYCGTCSKTDIIIGDPVVPSQTCVSSTIDL